MKCVVQALIATVAVCLSPMVRLDAQVTGELWCVSGEAYVSGVSVWMPVGRITAPERAMAVNRSLQCFGSSDFTVRPNLSGPHYVGAAFNIASHGQHVGVRGGWGCNACYLYFQWVRTGGTFRLILSAPQPTAGRLVLNATRSGEPSGASFTSLDIGDDGSIEHRNPDAQHRFSSLSVPIVIGTKPLPILLTLEEHLLLITQIPSFSSSFFVEIGFYPNVDRITTEGRPCGSELSGHLVRTNRNTLTLLAAETNESDLPFFIFGPGGWNHPIPPTYCPLLTDPVLSFPALARGGGSARLDLDVPNSLWGVLGCQFLGLTLDAQRAGSWSTSNLLRVDLR